MTPGKRIMASRAAQRALGLAAAWYVRLVRLSGRWTMLGGEVPEAFWRRGEPFIVCFWHGRLLMMPSGWPRRIGLAVLISQHRDGALIAAAVAHFGVDTVRGSSGRDGAPALRAMLKELERGVSIAITPDGPRGPRMRVSEGIVGVAQRSGRAIVPTSYAARPRRLLGTWDRFLLPLPFGRGVFLWGEPIAVPRQADAAALEDARLELEEALNRLTAEADRLVGLEPITPAPAPSRPLPEGEDRVLGRGAQPNP